jgi:hypothetical protein
VNEVITRAGGVFIAFNRRFDPGHSALKKAVDAGEIGKVEQITPTPYVRAVAGYRLQRNFSISSDRTWASNPESYRLSAFFAYYRVIKRALHDAVKTRFSSHNERLLQK